KRLPLHTAGGAETILGEESRSGRVGKGGKEHSRHQGHPPSHWPAPSRKTGPVQNAAIPHRPLRLSAPSAHFPAGVICSIFSNSSASSTDCSSRLRCSST